MKAKSLGFAAQSPKRLRFLVLAIGSLIFIVCFIALAEGAQNLKIAQESLPSPPIVSVNGMKPKDNLNAIKYVALAYSKAPTTKTLPLASQWNGGESNNLYSPAYQITLMESGAYILPWLALHAPGEWYDPKYYSKLIQYACENNLPITLVSTQWEYLLSDLNQFKTLPKSENPNTVSSIGSVQKVIRPDGRPSDWYSVGQMWAHSSLIQFITKQCSNPSLVIFVSNNEHPKQPWADAIYRAQLATGLKNISDDDALRKKAGDGWIGLYGSLIQGFRDGLPDGWKTSSRFIGYSAFSSSAMGRWPGWLADSLYTKGRLEPWMDVFEGASVEYYLYDWADITDFKVYSPQIEAMNYIPVLTDTLKRHPSFWFETSIWDGYEPAKNGGKRTFYKSIGQSFSECRYQGYVRFDAWLLRPRVLREYRGKTDYSNESYFNVILNVVDEINTNSELADFWKNSTLVENSRRKHPYQSNIPAELAGEPRWFLLDVNSNPELSNNHIYDIIETYAISLHDSKTDRYLLYTYSPQGEKKSLSVNIPGHGVVTVDASPTGSYYVINGNQIRKLETPQRYKACSN